ncbi:hypothetical protein F511_24442 [Dorcoceras hygrometricum]|uniref:Uncharacterized protein n=1 Tax=Dorcoceras hygrometricum TaxID=472368 RepID=A0A2Z7CU40_9LAMI|nr:hypothetical protein F511_24442 [Dorcoceras hygrometricum]
MKSRKQVSLVGTRSPIKRSWTRIISAIHDRQKENSAVARCRETRRTAAAAATYREAAAAHRRAKRDALPCATSCFQRPATVRRVAVMFHNQCASRRPSSVRDLRQQPASNHETAPSNRRDAAATMRDLRATRVSMTFRVVRTNQYYQDLELIHSTNGNHLESPNEDSSIDHQVTIYLHAQNITMFPTNETWVFSTRCYLEGLTRSARRIVSKTDRSKSDQVSGGGGDGGRRPAAAAALGEKGAAHLGALRKSHFQNPHPMLNTLSSVSVRESRIQYLCDPQWFRDTASRGPTTIVAPESQFRTCPSDHVVPEKSNAIVGVVTTGFECLPPSCDGLTGPDDHGPMISRLIDRGVSGNLAGQSGSSAGRSPHP